jgi:hypothetical protein
MSSKFLRTAILIISSLFLIVSFQNCGQPGGIAAGADMQKSSLDPLVVDVVAEMDNQEENNPYDYGKKDDGKDYAHDDDKDKKYDEEKDCKYDDELEDLLKNYACEDLAMGRESKKVLICHYPPGNPSNRHEICIGRAALKAHLSKNKDSAHMDHLGECKDKADHEVDHDDSSYESEDGQKNHSSGERKNKRGQRRN